MKVLKALQDAVTNHNLAVQPNPLPPEPVLTNTPPVRNHARQMPVHSFQVTQGALFILQQTRFCKVHVIKLLFYLFKKLHKVRKIIQPITDNANILTVDFLCVAR